MVFIVAAAILLAGVGYAALSGSLSSKSIQAEIGASGDILPGNFNSLSDGLNLTPAGATSAYFVNIKIAVGTELENFLTEHFIQPDSFYGKKITGMYHADYLTPSLLFELHDQGYDNTNDTTVKEHVDQGMKSVVYTRPLIYGHRWSVDKVLELMSNPESMPYQTYEPLLDAVDYKNAAYAEVNNNPEKFLSYISLTPIGGDVELLKAFDVVDYKSIPTVLEKYNPQMKSNRLIIKVIGNLTTLSN